MAWCDVVEPRTLRECRIALGQSQAAFAALFWARAMTWDGVARRPVSHVRYDSGVKYAPRHPRASQRPAPMAWCDVVESRTLRECRIALGQSQAAFAAMLGVSPESYRTWDAGRRATPLKILARARALATASR